MARKSLKKAVSWKPYLSKAAYISVSFFAISCHSHIVMKIMSNSVKNAIAVFVFLEIILYIAKPRLMFDDRGNYKPFGIGYDRQLKKRTLFTFANVTILLACLTYV